LWRLRKSETGGSWHEAKSTRGWSIYEGGSGVKGKIVVHCFIVAVRALRAAYHKGHDWLALSSQQRADEILLEWE
jgi:hypothetical protein